MYAYLGVVNETLFVTLIKEDVFYGHQIRVRCIGLNALELDTESRNKRITVEEVEKCP